MDADIIIRKLYRGATVWPLESFQHAALGTLAENIPFDSAMWGRGGEPPDAIVDVYLDRQPKRMIETYLAEFQHEDFLADTVRSQPGKTVNLVDLMSRAEFEKTRMYKKFARHWGVEQVLSTCWLEPVSGLVGFLSLWRATPDKPFSESERARLERLVPHLAEAHRLCRIGYMRQFSQDFVVVARQTNALCNPHGALIEAESAFLDLVRKEWRNWGGTTLPAELKPLLSRQQTYRGAKICISAKALDDMILLQARSLSKLDTLGKQQLLIAKRYARGDSAHDIAIALKLAENTVRSHIATIFKKCDVHNKAELAALLFKGTSTELA